MINSFIVCGFYTPSYSHWWPALQASLDHYRNPHDFKEVPARSAFWELNTLMKAAEINHAMDRNPDRTIIWLDVDCVVRGDLAPLANIRADIGVNARGRRRSNGSYSLHVKTGTMVFKPTVSARQFLAIWSSKSSQAHYGDVDQTAFALAMGDCFDTTFQPLNREWIGTKGDPKALILHDRASLDVWKISKFDRLLHRVGEKAGALRARKEKRA